ncbi:11084_t:CDS:2 [Entrophospora sp. SA101]|nr:11084_t:CDS:2 [Entrophospora sp. SA101]
MPSILSKQSTIVILIIALALCVVTTTLAEPYNFKYSLKKRSSRLLYKRQVVDPKIPVSPAVTSSTTTPIANSPAVNTKTVLTSVTLTSVVPAKTSKKTSTLDDGSTTVVETVEPAKTVVVVTAVNPNNQSKNTDQPSEDEDYDTKLMDKINEAKYEKLVEEQGKNRSTSLMGANTTKTATAITTTACRVDGEPCNFEDWTFWDVAIKGGLRKIFTNEL